MRALLLAAISAAALATSLAAKAEDSAAPPQTSPVEALSFGDPNRVVCMYRYHEGTIVRRQICHTAHAWQTEYEYQRQQVRDIQLLGLIQKHP